MGVQVSVEITPCNSLAIVKETDVMAKFLLHTLLLRSDKTECLQIDVVSPAKCDAEQGCALVDLSCVVRGIVTSAIPLAKDHSRPWCPSICCIPVAGDKESAVG